MMEKQDVNAAQPDDTNLKPPFVSPSDIIVSDETSVDKVISETMPVTLDEVLAEETTDPELQDQGENLVDKAEASSPELKDGNETKAEEKTESAEIQTASPLKSSTKTDDQDQDLEDKNAIPETESAKTSPNSETVKEDDNADGNADLELESGMMDPLEVARKVAMDVERDTESRERSCSTISDKTSDSKNGQKSPSQPPLVKDAKSLVSQVSEVAQDSEADTAKGFSRFDLNQEVCSEEVPVSSTISAVSASQPSAASTSALKPISDQRLEGYVFDLNAADGFEPKTLPFGEESSVEAYPIGPVKRHWDLNSIMYEGSDGQIPFVNQTRWQSPSRSSSSSSKQPSSLKNNIDLNLTDQAESVVIFGTTFGVKKNDNDPPVPQPSLSNLGPTQYAHNGFTSEPAMFFPSPMYGAQGMPVPYMVDSRGSPIMPQMMGSSLAPPFLMNMDPAGSSGVNPSHHPNFDLNSGLMINGANRETNTGLRQFLPQNGNEQYLRTSSPSGPIVNGKRHAPDSGWDFFPASKHQQQQPWR